jgi:4-amino-4-deoxy-L-arabinose transferase-like glycosyltransferase
MNSATARAENHAPPRGRGRLSTYLIFAAAFACIVFFSHWGLLDMPYFWDEVGHFIPAAWDAYHHGAAVPRSAVPNVHPPAVMFYLAAWWHVLGPSEYVTRCAMLVLASLTLLAAFLLAIELCGSIPGVPALLAVFLLAASPLFYTQALLAQLDLPATLFTALALYYFLTERHFRAAAACTLLVLAKETGAAVPLVLGVWLMAEKRWRRGLAYGVPLAALGLWLLVLRSETGHWLGDAGFARYNLTEALTPVRAGAGLLRRIWFLFFDNLHVIGTAAILAGLLAGYFNRRRWKAAAAVFCAHVLLVTFTGGAHLERYLLPVLPLFYTAVAAGLYAWRPGLRWAGFAILLAGLVAGLFLNSRFVPFPYENNLAMADFTALHWRAASYIESTAQGRTVATAWPLSAVLARPDLGYVVRPQKVAAMRDFSAAEFARIETMGVDIFVRFSRDWQPPADIYRFARVRAFARQYLGYAEPIPPEAIEQRLGLKLERSWSARGQWIEIYTR